MEKRLTSLILVAVFALPITTNAATIAELQSQIYELTRLLEQLQFKKNLVIALASAPCPILTQTMYRGMRGNDISVLQTFLARDKTIYPEGDITAYFGPATERAVKRFQSKYNIVSSGTPNTTGYGIVGRKTREKIKNVCQDNPIFNSVAPASQITQPVSRSAPQAQSVPAPTTTAQPPTPTFTSNSPASAEKLPALNTQYVSKTLPVQKDIGSNGQKVLANWPMRPDDFDASFWSRNTESFIETVFRGDKNSSAQYLPLAWLDSSNYNFTIPDFGLPSYVGASHASDLQHECIVSLASTLTAALGGYDVSQIRVLTSNSSWQEMNLFRAAKQCFNKQQNQGMFLNYSSTIAGESFWYDLLPNVLVFALLDEGTAAQKERNATTNEPSLDTLAYTSADTLYQMAESSKNGGQLPVFSYAGIRVKTDSAGNKTYAPVDPDCTDAIPATAHPLRECFTTPNQYRYEYDAAAALAFIGEAAFNHWHAPQHLQMGKDALEVLQSYPFNPQYELLLPFGALSAARMNARFGTSYDVDRLLNWIFSRSDKRVGWGMETQKFGDYSVYGLIGDGEQVFSMNAFVTAAALAPIIRYDSRYALSIAKYLSFVASHARYLYPESLPGANQDRTTYSWLAFASPTFDKKGIPFEKLRKAFPSNLYSGNGSSPYLSGDPLEYGWGPKTNLAIYMGAYVGLMNALIVPTDQPDIPMFDLVKTDFGANSSPNPTFAIYNPRDVEMAVNISMPEIRKRYPNVNLNRFTIREVLTKTNITSMPIELDRISLPVPSGKAIVIELIPAS